MIVLTKLNGEKFMVNQDLIEFVDQTPDTVISMTTGKKIPVAESLQAVQIEVIKFKRKIHCRHHFLVDGETKDEELDDRQEEHDTKTE